MESAHAVCPSVAFVVASDAEGFSALGHALHYAQNHNLGLMEAADVVCPFMNTCVSDFAHLRAAFLKNLDDPTDRTDV